MSETDRELLELAAKAAGLDAWWAEPFGFMLLRSDGNRAWEPLRNDGDALRLLVAIRGTLSVWGGSSNNGPCTTLEHDEFEMVERHCDDAAAATRRAIVRAAAAIAAAQQTQGGE